MRKLLISFWLFFVAFTSVAQAEYDITPFLQKGTQLYDSAQYRSAATVFKHACILQKDSFDAWFNFAASLYKLQKFALAQEAYNKAAELQTDSIKKSEALYGQANSLFKLNQYTKALDLYKQCLLLNPHDNDARYNYAVTQLKIEQEKSNEQDKNKNEQNNKKEPSAFAKQTKAKADQLVNENKFVEAFELMLEASKKDESVIESYAEYFEKLRQVAYIILGKKE